MRCARRPKPLLPKSKSTNKKFREMTKIPGVTFSWKRALGITKVKQQFARKTGIPTSKIGMERKVGKMVIDLLFKKRSN